MPYLIDGYNLLWAIQKNGDESEPISDIQLCHIVGRYLKRISDKGEIVFDGCGPPDKRDFYNVSNLDVVFVGTGCDADTAIENKIQANTAPKRLVVVSSDRRIRDAARRRKSITVKSDAFWLEVGMELSKRRGSNEPAEKQRGLSESETDRWVELFGLDQ